MRKWLRRGLVIVSVFIGLFGALAAYVYFQVDNRVTIDDTTSDGKFLNQDSIRRLDATTVSSDAVTGYIDSLTKKYDVAGLGVSIVNNGSVVYQHYFGQSNKPGSRSFLPGMIWYGASLSKTMLADVTLQMCEEGILHLDSPIYKYLDKPLPEYRTGTFAQFFGANNYNYADLSGDERYKKVTARMCLSHTTGLPNWRWLEPDRKLKFKFDPGQRYSYSGEGMFLLQLALENISGMDFEDLAVQKIFLPMHLTRSSFVWQRDYEGNYVIGHYKDGSYAGIPKRNLPNAAGSLSTTLEEYTDYFAHVLARKELRYQLMTTKQVAIPFKRQFGPEANVETHDNDSIDLGYGLGYGVYRTPFGSAFFKEGHDDGWQHYAVGFPDQGCALVLMSNSDNAEQIYNDIIEFTLANTYTPWYWEGYTSN
jgi:D-alanyl-D-alanine-carboxypeptidase/D-alanyl-D-alanine-endopeptidase